MNGYTNDDDTCKKTTVNIYKDFPMVSEQMLTRGGFHERF